jgi:hypothetical protein
LATPQSQCDSIWYPDSGATHHLTNDLANLNVRVDEYTGNDQIRVGNGTTLPIHHIGTTQLTAPFTSFLLKNVLHVPSISHNLLSVQKFTLDINTFLELHPNLFNVKDQVTRRTLLQGPSRNGLYPFPSSVHRLNKSNAFNKRIASPHAFIGARVTIPVWHSRLGHPAFCIVFKTVSRFGLLVISNSISNKKFCTACLNSKSKQLSFSSSLSQVTFALDLIFTDVWGLSPICSHHGNKYYISFLDAYSRYTWLYPMTKKNDAFTNFLKFQKYAEQFFNAKIKFVQFDWKGEYRTISTFSTNCGIVHRVSCPYTHQQNGAIERKNRHFVETGLALLSHSHMPL